MASSSGTSSKKVPLEPYPAPPLQAMGQEGYEYPPRIGPSAETFEAMVRRLHLKRRWEGGRGGGGTLAATAKSPTAAAEKDLASSLESVEEAMRDLLIVADLVHVAREEHSFIGQDSLTESQLPGGALPLPVSYIPPEVVLEMKKKSLAQAANDMASWVQQTQATLSKGRRLIGTVAGLRRTSRLRAGGRNVALARPLSAGDPLSVLIDTKKGPVILPFRVDWEGIPHVPGQGEEARRDPLGMTPPSPSSSSLHVHMFHGQQGTSASCSSWRPSPPHRAEGPAGLALRLQELDDEAYMGRLFEILRREVANPAQAWVDRYGICCGNNGTSLKVGGAAEAVGEMGRKAKMKLEGLRGVDAPLQVVEATGQHVVVEIDHLHELAIEFGAGREGRQPPSSFPQAVSLGRLSQLAFIRLVELGMQQGKRNVEEEEEDEGEEDEEADAGDHAILSRVTRELAHQQFMERLLSRLSRVVRRVGDSTTQTVVETMRWVEYPFTAPISRLVVMGRSGEAEDDSFLLEIRIRVTSFRVSWTCSRQDGGKENTTTTEELMGLEDLETFLQRKLSLLRDSPSPPRHE